MKPKISRRDLLTEEDIWNTVISVISEYDFPNENKVENEVFTVFQYYSELESGGHENLLSYFSEYIEEVGITDYLKQLVDILERIDAHDYALIEKEYGEEMWRSYIALENGEIDENEFYSVIEKADNKYHHLNDKLGDLLEMYFVNVYTELIEVVED